MILEVKRESNYWQKGNKSIRATFTSWYIVWSEIQIEITKTNIFTSQIWSERQTQIHKYLSHIKYVWPGSNIDASSVCGVQLADARFVKSKLYYHYYQIFQTNHLVELLVSTALKDLSYIWTIYSTLASTFKPIGSLSSTDENI